AISDDLDDAHEGIKFFKLYLENDFDIELAFINSFKDKDVGVIAGYMDDDVPRLISYNCMGNNGFQEHSFFKLVHSGSIKSTFVDQTEDFFSQIETKHW